MLTAREGLIVDDKATYIRLILNQMPGQRPDETGVVHSLVNAKTDRAENTTEVQKMRYGKVKASRNE